MEFGAGTEWRLQLVASDCSRHTVRAYAMSLLRFLRFCWATECRWDQVSERVVRDFVLWARQADKFTGAKNPPGPRLPVNRVTGKKVQTARYAPATINHTLSAVHEFYEFHREWGEGPLVNPVPVAGRHRHQLLHCRVRARMALGTYLGDELRLDPLDLPLLVRAGWDGLA